MLSFKIKYPHFPTKDTGNEILFVSYRILGLHSGEEISCGSYMVISSRETDKTVVIRKLKRKLIFKLSPASVYNLNTVNASREKTDMVNVVRLAEGVGLNC